MADESRLVMGDNQVESKEKYLSGHYNIHYAITVSHVVTGIIFHNQL